MHGSPCGLQLCMPTPGGSDELGYGTASHRRQRRRDLGREAESQEADGRERVRTTLAVTSVASRGVLLLQARF